MNKRLKKDIDLKTLKKYKFQKSWSGMYVYVDENNLIEIEINPHTLEIECDDEHEIIKKMELDGLLENGKYE